MYREANEGLATCRNQSWYQFNDEEVSKIGSLVPKIDPAKKGVKGGKDAKK